MLYSCAHMATVDVKGLRSDDRGSLISPMWSYDERLDAVYSEFVVTDMCPLCGLVAVDTYCSCKCD